MSTPLSVTQSLLRAPQNRPSKPDPEWGRDIGDTGTHPVRTQPDPTRRAPARERCAVEGARCAWRLATQANVLSAFLARFGALRRRAPRRLQPTGKSARGFGQRATPGPGMEPRAPLASARRGPRAVEAVDAGAGRVRGRRTRLCGAPGPIPAATRASFLARLGRGYGTGPGATLEGRSRRRVRYEVPVSAVTIVSIVSIVPTG